MSGRFERRTPRRGSTEGLRARMEGDDETTVAQDAEPVRSADRGRVLYANRKADGTTFVIFRGDGRRPLTLHRSVPCRDRVGGMHEFFFHLHDEDLDALVLAITKVREEHR